MSTLRPWAMTIFREMRLPGTSVNKGKKEGRGYRHGRVVLTQSIARSNGSRTQRCSTLRFTQMDYLWRCVGGASG